jgi:hypothetical protein
MTEGFVDAASVARLLADALESRRVPYAIGGAIAYGYYGAARGTKDVDINLVVLPDQARPALEALSAAGVQLDLEQAIQRGRERGDAVGHFGLVRVDLFFNSIELHERAAARTRTVILLGRPIQILSAEDTVILTVTARIPTGRRSIQKMHEACREALPGSDVPMKAPIDGPPEPGS